MKQETLPKMIDKITHEYSCLGKIDNFDKNRLL